MFTNHKVVFKKSESECKENFFCTLCHLPNSSFDDIETSKAWDGICNSCYMTYVEARRKEWKDGWRPDKETLEEYIYKRHEIILHQEKK